MFSENLSTRALTSFQYAADVDLCEIDVRYQAEIASATPNDPDFPKQYALVNSNVQPAWAQGLTGDKAITVCVVDTGIDYTHPDLAANVWVNPREAIDGKDNDGNGTELLCVSSYSVHVSAVGRTCICLSATGPVPAHCWSVNLSLMRIDSKGRQKID